LPLIRLISRDVSSGLKPNRLVMYRYRLDSIQSSLEETREISRRVEVQEPCRKVGWTGRHRRRFFHHLGSRVVGLLGWIR